MKTKLTKEMAEAQLDYMIEERFPHYEKKLNDENMEEANCKLCSMTYDPPRESASGICSLCILGECGEGLDARSILISITEVEEEEMKKELIWWCHQMRDKINKTMEKVGSSWRVDLDFREK